MTDLMLNESTVPAERVLIWRARAASIDAIGAGTLVAGLAAAHGGYWPNSWSWAMLAAVASLATLVATDAMRRLGLLDVAFAVGFGGLAIWMWFSVTWSPSAGAPLEAQRATMYALVSAVALVGVRRGRTTRALAGVLVAVVLVSAYSLAERLFPDRFGAYDPVAVYRLSGPIGYWNGLGVFAVVGLVLALAFAARGRSIVLRALASASTVILLATLYFTFGRAAWIALAFGFVVTLALDPRRLQLLVYAAALAPAGIAAVLLSSHSDALTHRFRPAAAAAHDGHQLAVALTVVAACAAAAIIGLTTIERAIHVPSVARRTFAIAVGTVAVAALAFAFAQYGGPATLAHQAYDSFKAPPVAVKSDLNKRLFSLSSNGRIDMWRAASRDYAKHPVLGSGAGSFEVWWNRHRPSAMQVRNAHSLYLETLAELGPIGLVVVLGVIAIPLVAAFRARRDPLVPAAAGAFAAYALHAGVDWDWQLAGVTTAALICGSVLVVAARKDDRTFALSRRARLIAVAALCPLSIACVYAVIANTALSRAEMAASRSDYRASEAAGRKATRWMSWSADSWRLLGEAQLALRRPGAARSLRKSIERDGNNWLTWFDLAAVTGGREHAHALARARELNPLSPEIRQLVSG